MATGNNMIIRGKYATYHVQEIDLDFMNRIEKSLRFPRPPLYCHRCKKIVDTMPHITENGVGSWALFCSEECMLAFGLARALKGVQDFLPLYLGAPISDVTTEFRKPYDPVGRLRVPRGTFKV